MIIDHINQAAHYYGLGEKIKAGLIWLAQTELSDLQPGRYDLSGSDLYALVQIYDTKDPADGIWEAHRRYLDIQYVASGSEQIGYAPIGSLKAETDYDAGKDFQLLQGSGVNLACGAGTFMILYPQDAHMPGLALGQPQPVRKVVVKVRID
ncbi:MAG TPA: YhcH/YjgK/YiaL family protein [Clostridiales bacterium]|nr:YhcH/YjgK/YiaL family protein [Clostridiales bacterium]